jgi:FMN phosphatase YigB (HAD superfamily)
MLRAALVDVGGTLWPDAWPRDVWASMARRELVERFGMSDTELERLLTELDRRDPAIGMPLRQDTISLIADALRASALHHLDPQEVLVALDIPAASVTRPFEGAGSFLRGLNELRLRVVIVSNTFFRTEQGMRRDFDELGMGTSIDGIVSSADAGVRKPNPEMFRRALVLANSSADKTVMIGDSEEKDILPAKALGMKTIRVAIEGGSPASSQADAVAYGLEDASRLLLGLATR